MKLALSKMISLFIGAAFSILFIVSSYGSIIITKNGRPTLLMSNIEKKKVPV